ncbi:MAG: flippase-like domain-containing protein [Bacteroidetes bacterium]|nr:flippase-like domain-containing protein [Bacteroidota bacterium]
MNKNTKIRLNYVIGAIISLLLLWAIYVQVSNELHKTDFNTAWQTGPVHWLYITVTLMLVNLFLEAWKWYLLAQSAQPLTFKEALFSYLYGLAFSIITPNRIGEYPGRLLFMKRKNPLRLVSVSILGSVAQMLTLCIFGCAGLMYYYTTHHETMIGIVLWSNIALTIVIGIAYWRFETWIPFIEKIKWLKRYRRYGNLLKKFSSKQQLTILSISLLRYGIYTTQYVLMLYWMNIHVPPVQAFLLSALFFWVIAIVPSVAILELGTRGGLGMALFGLYSDNVIGILAATAGIWCINLMLPAIAGSLLSLRMRLLR